MATILNPAVRQLPRRLRECMHSPREDYHVGMVVQRYDGIAWQTKDTDGHSLVFKNVDVCYWGRPAVNSLTDYGVDVDHVCLL